MFRKRVPGDGAYKAFFTDKDMVTSLVQDFVPVDFVCDMDFSTLEPFPTARVTRGFFRREDDVIWRVHWQNVPSYLFLLLEFQSSVDPFMPVRILVYAGLLWLYLIEQGEIKSGDSLPPIFPIVLYNGRTKWQAARDIKSLLPSMPKGLQAYQPAQKFFLVDENALSQEMLDAAKGVSAHLFRLERLRMGDPFVSLLRSIHADLQHYPASLRQKYEDWIYIFLKGRKIITSEADYQRIKGDSSMFGEALKEWEEDLLLKGEKRGKKLGKKLGKKEGLELGKKQGLELGEKRGEKRGERLGKKLGLNLGKKQGEEKGLKKAEAGIIADMKDLLFSMLRERFSRVSRSTSKAIRSLQQRSTLKDLISAVYRVQDMAAFNALLESKLTPPS